MRIKIIVSNNDQQLIKEFDHVFTVKPRGLSSIRMESITLNPDYVLLILNEMPARIDHETPFNNLWLLSDEDVEAHPEPYRLLPNYSKSETIWRKEVIADSQNSPASIS